MQPQILIKESEIPRSSIQCFLIQLQPGPCAALGQVCLSLKLSPPPYSPGWFWNLMKQPLAFQQHSEAFGVPLSITSIFFSENWKYCLIKGLPKASEHFQKSCGHCMWPAQLLGRLRGLWKVGSSSSLQNPQSGMPLSHFYPGKNPNPLQTGNLFQGETFNLQHEMRQLSPLIASVRIRPFATRRKLLTQEGN